MALYGWRKALQTRRTPRLKGIEKVNLGSIETLKQLGKLVNLTRSS